MVGYLVYRVQVAFVRFLGVELAYLLCRYYGGTYDVAFFAREKEGYCGNGWINGNLSRKYIDYRRENYIFDNLFIEFLKAWSIIEVSSF